MDCESDPDAAEWEIVCDAEKRAFEHMEVYKVVPRPKGRKVVGSRWVFCIKRGPDSAILKYKACVVAQGFTQIEGVDYDEKPNTTWFRHPGRDGFSARESCVWDQAGGACLV
jgi:hypothetical protein